MINKMVLQSFISKYYLGGTNTQAKWRFKEDKLTVYAGRPGEVCKVELSKFPFPEVELGIFDTHTLNKLISITSGDLHLKLIEKNKIPTQLAISDRSYDLTYTLADLIIMGKVSYYRDPDTYEVEIELSSEDIHALVKAKGALPDEDYMVINTLNDEVNGESLEILFGDSNNFSNKISYKMQGDIKELGLSIPFNSNTFKEILTSNKNMDNGVLRISKLGMMKLNFHSEDIQSEYFVARTDG